MDLSTIKNTGNWGNSASRLNENFSKVGTEVDKLKYAAYNSKLYASEALLKQAIPSPSVGDWAIVGNSIPGEIYRCDTDGEWTATGQTGGGYGMEVTEKHVTEQYVTEVHNEYTGDIVNNPDDEDLISEELAEGGKVLKLADKMYNASAFSGLGRVYLRKNVTASKNILTQAMISNANTRYIIQYDYDLNGQAITIPKGCILDFQGGSISNGELVGNQTCLQSDLVSIFNNISRSGSWNLPEVYPEWFGAKGDGITDDTEAISEAILFVKSSGGKVKFSLKTYCFSSINLVGCSNIMLEGSNDATLPWIEETTLKVINDTQVAIRTVADYSSEVPPASAIGKSIKIKSFFLECNSKANVGINCCQDIYLENLVVRRAKIDGIVFESQTYPVYLFRVESSFNGRHGLYVKAPNTTVYSLYNVELDYNDGYGLYIEDGNCATLVNVVVQANKRGGVCIFQRPKNDFTYPIFLGNLTFLNLYTEANGTLPESDANYEGNYALKIQGRDNDNLFTGKIDKITLIGGTINYPSTGQPTSIKGTSNFNSYPAIPIDLSVNARTLMQSFWVDSLIIGSYSNNSLKKYNTVTNKSNLFSKDGSNNTLPLSSQTVDVHVVGTETSLNGSVTWEGITSSDIFAKLGIYDNNFKLAANNPDRRVIGYGYYMNGSEMVSVLLEIESYSTNNIYLRKQYGGNVWIKFNELPASGTLHFSAKYSSL